MIGVFKLVEFLIEKVEDVIGGKIVLGDDFVEVVNNIEFYINEKRKGLGL